MVTETSQTSQTISTVSGASVYLGGYGLRSGPGSLTLDPGFIANVEPLINAAAKNKYDAVSSGPRAQAHGPWRGPALAGLTAAGKSLRRALLPWLA